MLENNKLARYAAIFEDIKAGEIMSSNVVEISGDKKIAHAKELMKIKKISGMPVVDEKKQLIGIISIEDIIHALEFNKINDPIHKIMSTQVVTIHKDDSLIAVVDKFESYKYGRFPVVDDDMHVCGIISKEDILHGILEKFNLIYIHDQKRTSTLNTEYSAITGEKLEIEEAEFHYQIDSSDIDAAGTGAAMLKQFLTGKNFHSDIVRRVGVATYEAETNVVIHSHGQGDIYFFQDDDRFIVRVVDNGVGIEDLDRAMKEGYSTATDYIRERGFGAGMGIANMKRFADKLVIISEKNAGTQVEMIFYLPAQTWP
ncbi:MAG TPA: CBS domain-containing protein, partial [Patescibacteria group bacterium]|nr:CBS domain-containing protein [Patescibacteria group bacterium]